MSRYKFLLSMVIIFLFAKVSFAQDHSQTQVLAPTNHFWSLSVGMISWQEQLSLNSGSVSDWGYANFQGNSLTLNYESYFQNGSHQAGLAEISYLAGVTTATAAGGILSYNTNNTSWSAEEFSYRYLYRVTEATAFSVGPYFLSRQISYIPSQNGMTLSSGASFNYGILADFRARLTPSFQMNLGIGTLLTRASTLWDLSVGYVF